MRSNGATRMRLFSWAMIVIALSAGDLSVARAAECTTTICVGDPCSISGVHELADQCDLDFGTKTVTVTGVLKTAAPGESFSIEAGNLVVQGKLEAIEGSIEIAVENDFTLHQVSIGQGIVNVSRAGTLNVFAARDVRMLGRAQVTAIGAEAIFAGEVYLEAGRDVVMDTLSEIHADGGPGGDGGIVGVVAGTGNVTLNGTVTALGSGLFASGGSIGIEAGQDGTISVTNRVEATTTNNGLLGGVIQLGPACDIVVSGTVRDRNNNVPNGSGTTFIEYHKTLNVTGSSLLADAFGNQVFCRCIDANSDGFCDGGCDSNPAGTAQATINPPLDVIPIAAPPCE